MTDFKNNPNPGGPRPPYGPPIDDAIAKGDLLEMKTVAESARKALYPLEDSSIPKDSREEIVSKLNQLEEAIKRLENRDSN